MEVSTMGAVSSISPPSPHPQIAPSNHDNDPITLNRYLSAEEKADPNRIAILNKMAYAIGDHALFEALLSFVGKELNGFEHLKDNQYRVTLNKSIKEVLESNKWVPVTLKMEMAQQFDIEIENTERSIRFIDQGTQVYCRVFGRFWHAATADYIQIKETPEGQMVIIHADVTLRLAKAILANRKLKPQLELFQETLWRFFGQGLNSDDNC